MLFASSALRLAGGRVQMYPWHVSAASPANVLITDKGGKIPIHVGDRWFVNSNYFPSQIESAAQVLV